MSSQIPNLKSQISSLKSQIGFTLIELLVVIAIIAILIGVVRPMASVSASRTREFRCESNLRQIALGMRAYVDDYGSFPRTLADLDSVLQDRSLLSCPGTRAEYAYLPPAKEAARDAVVFSCVRPGRRIGAWPHRFGNCYLELTAGGEVRRVIGQQARR